MAKKKGGKKKAQDDYWDEAFEQDAAAATQEAEAAAQKAADPSSEPSAAAPKEPVKTGFEIGEEPDYDDDYGLMAQASRAAKKGKKQQQQKQQPATEADEGADDKAAPAAAEEVGEVRIKSKKEKEREKKERQKEEKRKAAQKAKEQGDSGAKGKKPSQDTAQQGSTTANATELGDEAGDNGDAAAAGKGKGKKKGGIPAKLRKMLEAQRAAEEEAQRREEEERKRIEEEERRIAEEERIAAEEAERKREEKRLKREKLRKEGKLLSKTEKERLRKAEQMREQLLASGMIPAEMVAEEEAPAADQPKKRVVYGSKKKKGQQQRQETDQASAPEAPVPAAVEVTVVATEEKAEESDAAEDAKASWEDGSDNEDVKDSWDISSEEEEDAAEQQKEPLAAKAVKKSGAEATKAKNASAEDSEEEDEDSEEDSEEESSDEELSAAQKLVVERKRQAAERRQKRIDEAMAARSKDDLRSPICCILGHVDTGKTKLLDKIRQTNVQEGEAGGITQQIGATYFPIDAVKQKTACLTEDTLEYKLPGLLVIDTPGHESFTNLRTRGSSLCNIAILVVDIVHGLEPQTLESLRLLRDRKTPFIVALNKIDRMYDWQPVADNSFRDSLKRQKQHAQQEFQTRAQKVIVEFAEQGLNACLYYDNKNLGRNVSLVPTSAITGEGIPDLLHLLVQLTQTRMNDKLMYLSELECTVLEVKVIEGLGTTIDVVLSNGVLNESDRIVICGLNGPIATNVRALLTPQPLRELRVKSAYVHHKTIKAAMGVKICAPDLEKAIAGSRLLVVGPDDDEEELMDEIMSDLQTLLSSVDKSGRGVCVQASTIGSLEALLEFLRVSNIPVSGINIGPVHKRDIIRCSAMLERAKEYAVMLCFDVKIDKEAQEMADELGVKVFSADIIYHLFDQFTAYTQNIMEQRRKDQAPQAVFPCILRIIPGCVFNKRDPIILGVDVVEGSLRPGTPMCVVNTDSEGKKEILTIGRVTSIEQNHKTVEIVKKGQAQAGVAVKIECPVYDTPKLVGRHFTEQDELYSRITRQSIDVLKESFRADLSKDEWALVVRLKKTLDIN